ncbi:HupE/UreJ family protein [Enterobacteriaceae bacterium C34A]
MRLMSKTAMVSLLTLFPALAMAHPGHDGGAHHAMGFAEGFMHPLTGADHLIVMLLVGVWSAMNTRQWWMAPVAFALLLLVGALAGMAGVAPGGTELIVAASLLGLGAMVAFQMKLPEVTGALVIGAFAIFHGLAHGAELSHSMSALSGMVLATAGLHLAGLGLGWLMMRSAMHRGWSRLLGGCASLTGIGLLAGIL